MNLSDFFALQCTSPSELELFASLEINLRCLSGEKGLDKALAFLEKNYPHYAEQRQSSWFTALVAAIRPFYKHNEDGFREDSYTHPLEEFLSEKICQLNDSRFALIGQIKPDLSRFSESELAQPHMQWVKAFTNRLNQLREDFPNHARAHIRLTRVHPLQNISDDKLLELNTEYFNEEWLTSMDFTQYVEWYIKSTKHFNANGSDLTPDMEKAITATLNKWLESSQDIDSHLCGIARNYEFHPQHNAFLKTFIERLMLVAP